MNDKATILAVDDTSGHLALLVKILTREGYDVRPADSGELALADVAANPPDLILLDVRMKDMDGLEVCRRLKAREETRHIPIILISAFADAKEWVEGLQLGAADYIAKPFQSEELLTRVKTHLSLGRANVSLEQQTAALRQTNEQLQSEIAGRQHVEDELRQGLDRAERSRQAILSTLEDQKRAEEALRGSEERLRDILFNMADWVWEVDENGVYTYSSEKPLGFLGSSPEDIVGKTPFDFMAPDEAKRVAAIFSESAANKAPIKDLENWNIGRNGERICLLANAVPILDAEGNLKGYRGVDTDITARKRSEKERALNFETQAAMNALLGYSLESRTTDEFLQRSLDLILSLQWLAVGAKGAIFLADKAEESLHLHVHKGLPKDLRVMCSTVPFGRCLCGRAAAERAIQFADRLDDRHDVCYEGMPPHGHYCVPILSGDHILGVVNLYVKEGHTRSPREEDFLRTVANTLAGTIERMRAEDALALHVKRVQALLDLHLLSYAHEDQVLDFVLEACLGMTQSKLSFVGAMNETESVLTVHRWSKGVMDGCALSTQTIEFPTLGAGLWCDCVRRREPVICNDYQAPHPGKKGLPGGHVPIHRFAAVPVLDGTRIVAVATVANKEQDYTAEDTDALSTLLNKMWEILSRQRRTHERETIEDQYRQAQKMEAIGQLAGGVAHDFNNILQSMVGYSGMLLDRLPEHDETHEFAEEIAHGAEQAAALTRQLLTFSRRQILEMEDLEFNDVVRGLTKMIRRTIGENIEVKVVDDPHLGIVHADRGQMEQVLINLCVNARDAMPEGGTLTIKTENVALDTEYCAAHAWASPGRFMLLTVADTGCGMDNATQACIFEPFFTTKEVGKGTGLGLATVYGIVRQHGGMVQLYSEVEKGTTFKIYLPSVERTAAPVAVKVVERARGGTETILVAEDEETLRKLAIRILESAGYTVLLAANGKDALDVFAKHAAEIDLVVLDVVMPKMGGKAVYDALYPQHPRLRFLFSSGYSRDAVLTGFVLQDGIELIQKPYGPNALLSKVREILDQVREEGILE